ncbi:hypothetical protein [Paenibacillus sp. DMB20]|uniref:hypothetical protein n=1 Tax=Paenibacillus sp. DMB20 TaxID=1642570 RepID=UPI000B2230F6|nr:hypothetical protein [Paenibacillus sp. DMB20]
MNSIVYKFSASLTIILVILFSVLVLSNIYSLEVVRNQTLNNSKNTLAIYVENIHNNLNIFSKDLTEVFENNIDTATNYANSSESSQYFKSMHLMNALKAKMTNNYSSDGMFIRFSGHEKPFVQFGNRLDASEKLVLVDFVNKSEFKPNPNGKIDEWTDFKIDGAHYLFKYITYSNISFGTFVKANTLLSIANREGSDLNHYLLSDRNGSILSSTNGDLEHAPSALTLDDLSKRYGGNYLFYIGADCRVWADYEYGIKAKRILGIKADPVDHYLLRGRFRHHHSACIEIVGERYIKAGFGAG